tara:strand:+ start:49643 stop:50449 length:807 start_codon:yes stop_codon:yes gene_type:complete
LEKKHITSFGNNEIKFLTSLKTKSSFRKKNCLFYVEGEKYLLKAIKSGFKIEKIYTTIDELNKISSNKKFESIDLSSVITLKNKILDSILFRPKSSKIIALLKQKKLELENFSLKKNEIILILDSIEKPGNIGGIFRTADATKIDYVVISNPKTDIYNPNIIKASEGAIFNLNIAESNDDEIFRFLEKNNIKLFCTSLSKKTKLFTKVSFLKSFAVAFGSEDKGLSQKWLEKSNENITIPMFGRSDSLNVSVTSSIIIYEALKQRKIF